MIVLAIDTSHSKGSAAVSVDGEAAGTAAFGDGTSHLTEIGNSIRDLLAGGGLTVGDVDRVALVQGPGSFTGLRIGMAFAKGLCAGLGSELVVKPTLELLALPVLRRETACCAMVDARKGEVYGAVYGAADGPAAHTAPVLVDPRACEPRSLVEAAKPHQPVYLGTGALRYRPVLDSADPGCRVEGESAALPSSALLAEIAPRLDPLSGKDLAALEPLYIRASDAVYKALKPIDPHG